MERINNSLNNMKDVHGVDRSQFAAASNNNYYGRDMLGKFSWPPRPYTCSFCKREFRSAQALGGHMNVHRRDRARLRQSSPSDDHLRLNTNPNPNFNYSTSPSSSSAYNKPFTQNFPPFSTPPSSITLSSAHEENIPTTMFSSSFDPSSSKNMASFATKTNVKTYNFEVGELKGFLHEQDDEYCKKMKKSTENNSIVTLDLEMCLSSKDGLDLELRLGYN